MVQSLKVGVVLLLLVAFAWGDPKLETTLEPTEAPFGTSLRYEVVLSVPKEQKFEPPAADSVEFEGFEIRDAYVTELPPTEGANRWRYTFQLARYEPGTFVVEAPEWTIAEGEPALVGETKKVKLTGAKKLDSDQPGEIRGLKGPAWTPWPLWFYVAGLLALLLVFAVLRSLFRGLQSRLTREPEVIPLTPYEWAQKELDELDKAGLLDRDQTQLYSERLSDVLRGYLARQHQLPVLERTTSELLKVLRAAGFSDEKRRRIKGILELADLVKFAKRHPTSEEARAQLKETESLLEEER